MILKLWWPIAHFLYRIMESAHFGRGRPSKRVTGPPVEAGESATVKQSTRHDVSPRVGASTAARACGGSHLHDQFRNA